MKEILIKNMVCQHCIRAVERVLSDLNLKDFRVELGRACLKYDLPKGLMEEIEANLHKEGFEIILDHNSSLVEKTKHAILHHIRDEKEKHHNLSDCIENRLGVSYDTISRIFSVKEGRTLEKYHIAQKVERVKELLQHGEYTLSEIADMVDYSSVAHLSRQFKNVTGMTPSEYIKGKRERSGLNDV